MKKTLGGDRLGSGKKMQIEMHNYNRSTHDMGYIWRSTMAAGTLIPFLKEPALPGDTFDINLDVDIKTHPTIGPLFGSYKVQLDIFECPIRLYQGKLHNNALGIGMNMAAIKLPIFQMETTPFDPLEPPTIPDKNTSQINPSCLLAYLGIRGIGNNAVGDQAMRDFNAVPLLAYWDIYKNYYANKQEEIGAVIHTSIPALIDTVDSILVDNLPLANFPTEGPLPLTESITITFTGTQPLPSQIMINTSIGRYSIEELTTYTFLSAPGIIYGIYDFEKYGEITALQWQYRLAEEPLLTLPGITTFPLASIDQMRNEILAFTMNANPFVVNEPDLAPYAYVIGKNLDEVNFATATQEGLGLKTYQSDLFNNWLKTEWIEGPGSIAEITAVSTAGDQLKLDALVLARKVYDMLNRIAVSGGSYNDWIDAVYQENKYTRCESPIYHGGLIKELIFQEVVSNSAEGGQPLGTLAGKGVMAKKHKGGGATIKISEPGYIIGIISLTPRIDYSQGNKWDTTLLTMDDFHKPALDEIGFQDLITEQMAWWSTRWNPGEAIWEQASAGKQPAWINYMTNVNQCYGNFAIENNEMFMTLNRRYEYDVAQLNFMGDLTTYIDPAKYNQIFAQTSLDSQNFWAQIAVDITARRLISARVMPNL